MYVFLFDAHMGCYCLENYCVLDCTCESLHEYYHECIHECMHCRVMGSPSVSPPCGYKRWGRGLCQNHQSFSSHGLSLVFLLSPSWSLCSLFQQNMLEENLRVTRKVLATPSSHSHALSLDPFWTSCPCIFHWGRFPVDWLGLVVSHPWGCLFLGAQELTSLVKRLNFVTTYSGRRRSFSRRCYKRTYEVITVICLHTLKTFLPEYEYHYSLDGNNKFVLCHGLGPI